MHHALLVQLPVPQLNFGHQTGNTPFGAACLHQAAAHVPNVRVEIFSQISASYMGDAALVEAVLSRRPDIIGFTTYMWNVTRVLYLIRKIKEHYTPQIVLGGPEVTADNPLIHDECVDFRVYGEGERLFVQLLQDPDLWTRRWGRSSSGPLFSTAPSPYLSAPLIPQIENTMLLETMRGCPYACAYCFYSKSRRRPEFKADHRVLEGVQWALARDVKEIYFLDPSLNSRPGLKPLLHQIARLNKDHRLALISEIRADAVDDELACLLATAGFTWFEIGLQSTNPKALAQMHRFANLDRFLKGVQALKQRQITTAVDLIVGLPGDDWDGFQETIQFVVNHKLHDDIQVFPLSVLPGTEFRRRAHSLGLVYEKDPPYSVINTPTFSQTDILRAFDHAESRLDVSLYPLPDLDLAWRTGNGTDIATAEDMPVALDDHRLFSKVCLRPDRTPADLTAAARCVTQPYQLLIPPTTTDLEYVTRALSIFTESNPHTPLEIVFFNPVRVPDVCRLLQAARIARPHYLDGDLRLLFAEAGNRTVLLTIVCPEMTATISGPMQRSVYWWQRPDLPTVEMIHGIEAQGFDGLLIDTPTSPDRLWGWQDKMAPLAGDLILISFAWPALYKRWLQKTVPGDYCFQILP